MQQIGHSVDPVYFWKGSEKPYGVFCQWVHSPFTLEGIKFNTTEHYMMYSKAMLFNDHQTAAMILTEKRPKFVKSLGRKVSGFDQTLWEAHREKIVLRANKAKFSQNKAMASILMETGDREIIEASPFDFIWGIGFDKSRANANRNKWGLNLLGKALMKVREDMRAGF